MLQEQTKQPLFGSDIIKPAAEAAPQGGQDEEGAKDRPWLRNLVCGFDMEIPAERLQQETVGAYETCNRALCHTISYVCSCPAHVWLPIDGPQHEQCNEVY